MTSFSVLGFIALAITSIAYFPQVFRTMRTGSSKDLSAVTLGMLFLGSLLWFIYGTWYRDMPLMIAHGLTAILTGILFYIKLISKSK
jgi:MtN3 and saliva related transmembrane protein